MLLSFEETVFERTYFHKTRENIRKLIPHMGLISEVIISISEQCNNHGKSDFPYVKFF